MKLRGLGYPLHGRFDNNLRHHFVIGPLCDSYLFNRRARLYYCTRCRWSFLVAGNSAVVVDEDGRPLGGDEAAKRFRSFENGPCPILHGLAGELSPERTVSPIVGAVSTAAGLAIDGNADGHTPERPSPAFRAWLRTPIWHRRAVRSHA
jgi:hypothetical protein